MTTKEKQPDEIAQVIQENDGNLDEPEMEIIELSDLQDMAAAASSCRCHCNCRSR